MNTLRIKHQVTEWGHPEELIRCQWADSIGYRRWLDLEAQRWADKWREAWIEENSEGLVALFTWKDYVSELPEDQS